MLYVGYTPSEEETGELKSIPLKCMYGLYIR
jgi:hypothetical protein